MLDKATSKWAAADAIKAAYKFIMTRDIFPLTVRKLLDLQAVLAPVAVSATNPAISRFCNKINEWMSDYTREQPGFGMLEKVVGVRCRLQLYSY